MLYDISRYFDVVWGCHPPFIDPQKSIFSTAQARVPVFYDISRYLTDKYFDIVWERQSLRGPPNGPRKNQFFEWLNLECQCFMISADKYFDIVWGCNPPRGPPKHQFFLRLKLGCQCFMISADI